LKDRTELRSNIDTAKVSALGPKQPLSILTVQRLVSARSGRAEYVAAIFQLPF
jgi:hypothetical protein